MKKSNLIVILSLIALFGCNQTTQHSGEITKDSLAFPESALQFCQDQIWLGVKNYKQDDSVYIPRTTADDGSLVTNKSRSWTSGFFPGSLWYLFEYADSSKWRENAEIWTQLLEKEKNNTYTHDLGFMLYCSYGNGYRLTKNQDYKEVLVQGANSLITRYDSIVNLIKSWDWSERWQYPVIIDNMMNLEFLFWATKETGDSIYYNIAVNHADKTMKNHFREDNSSYHVVDYDTITGEAIWKGTHQGYSDSSAWARGQAWGLYGYTLCYRETKKTEYLEQAEKIAEFILNHPNLPDDKVPFWDFNAPDIPNTERDASAGAIIASALLELQDYVDESKKPKYANAAETILKSLASNKYCAALGKNNYFVLKHSVGHKPGGVEVDVPLVYADYYFIEGLLRYIQKKQH